MVKSLKILQKIIPKKDKNDIALNQIAVVDFSNVDKLEVDDDLDYIGSQITAIGILDTKREIVIAGEIIGNIWGQDFSLLEGGLARCNIRAVNVNLGGKLIGQISCEGQINIDSTGIVKATLEFEQLSIELGAILEISAQTNDIDNKELI